MSMHLRVSLAALVAAVAVAAPTKASAEPHPAMYRALYELREARVDLKEASHNFGGHREKALLAVDAAINQIETCLKAVGDEVKPFKGHPAEVYKKYDNHPHIHHAVVELKASRAELHEASHNYGGHKEKAIKDVDYAIEELEHCLKFPK